MNKLKTRQEKLNEETIAAIKEARSGSIAFIENQRLAHSLNLSKQAVIFLTILYTAFVALILQIIHIINYLICPYSLIYYHTSEVPNGLLKP